MKADHQEALAQMQAQIEKLENPPFPYTIQPAVKQLPQPQKSSLAEDTEEEEEIDLNEVEANLYWNLNLNPLFKLNTFDQKYHLSKFNFLFNTENTRVNSKNETARKYQQKFK